MATTIAPVTGNVTISSGLFVKMTLGGTDYFFSNAYEAFNVDGDDYTDLGSLLSVGEFTYDYKATQGSLAIAISGIPNTTDFMNIIQTQKIRGGDVEVRRVFFDPVTQEPLSGEVYLRFKGLISNYVIEEEADFFQGRATNTIVFECASVFSLLANKVSGQRTNGSDRRKYFTNDPSFDNVKYLKNLPGFG